MRNNLWEKHNARRRVPTVEQKREYLRRLLADGPQAAAQYLQSVTHPVCMMFETDEQADEYIAKTGHRPGIVFILPPDDSDTP